VRRKILVGVLIGVGAVVLPIVGHYSVAVYKARNYTREVIMPRLEYGPKGLMDLFYGTLDEETQNGVPPFSYSERYYKESSRRADRFSLTVVFANETQFQGRAGVSPAIAWSLRREPIMRCAR